jgi:hypothetical protein
MSQRNADKELPKQDPELRSSTTTKAKPKSQSLPHATTKPQYQHATPAMYANELDDYYKH